MKLCFNVEVLEKAFGQRDMSKLTRKKITDKNGKRTTVLVRTDDNGQKQRADR